MKRTVVFVALLVATAGLGAALRLPGLDRRPMHVDEAVHAAKFDALWQTGVYAYDLNEYHGPTLYYATLPAAWLSEARRLCETDAAMFRVVPVIFGVGLILLLGLVGDGLGRSAAIIAGVLTAVSPAMVYYSRYYIQETLLVFFTFAVIAAVWRAKNGVTKLPWAVLAGAAVGLMHATKETCVIAWGCMFAAVVVATLAARRTPLPSRSPRATRGGVEGLGEGRSGVQGRAAEAGPAPHPTPSPQGRGVGGRQLLSSVHGAAVLAGVVAVIVVSVVLFSGFGTNPAGPPDSIRAFATYFQRAGEGGAHEHPWHYYLHILLWWRHGAGPVWTEALIVALAGVGIVAAATGHGVRAMNLTFVRFLAVYTLLMFLIYSAIPYKTPWCILSALHGMIVLAGVGAATLLRGVRVLAARCKAEPRTARSARMPVLTAVLVAAVLLAGTVQLGWQAQRSISPRFDASHYNPCAYSYTVRDVERLAAQLDELAALHPAGRQMLIKVIVPNPWPLPWYLRCFEQVGYWESVPDDPDADVILVSHTLQPELDPHRRDEYQVSLRGLRRDEVLYVYVRPPLWEAYVARQRGADAPANPPSPP
ncbi:MAG: flippase activity-associated protein Agl23 [Planctomycetota bacterium]